MSFISSLSIFLGETLNISYLDYYNRSLIHLSVHLIPSGLVHQRVLPDSSYQKNTLITYLLFPKKLLWLPIACLGSYWLHGLALRVLRQPPINSSHPTISWARGQQTVTHQSSLGHHLFFVNKVLLENNHMYLFKHFLSDFTLPWQGFAVTTDTTRPTETKIFTILLFMEKVDWSLP